MFDTSHLGDFQRRFLKEITGDRSDLRAGLRIYRDTWLLGLIDVLRGRFEVTFTTLGDEAFNAFARDYVHCHPLKSGDRSGYGAGFGDFLRQHPQAATLGWLGDLVAFEQALDEAHHAIDAEPCGFETLMAPETRCGLHPSTRLLRMEYDIAAFHAALGGSDQATLLPQCSPCNLLIGRTPLDEVIWLGLSAEDVRFLGLVQSHNALFTALEILQPDADDMAGLQVLLARLVQNGLLTEIRNHEER